jgi:hypothetical protein
VIKFYSKIKKIEQKKRIARGWKIGPGDDDANFEYENMGWFMLLEGSWEYLYIGDTEPASFRVGDEVEVTIAVKS